MIRLRITTYIALAVLVITTLSIGLYFMRSAKVPEETVVTIPQSSKTEDAVKFPIHSVIGHSVEGRDIDAYTYGKGTTLLMFVGGMHGGYEWNSVLLAYAFMDYLDAKPNVIPDDLTIVVIPSANPDGVYKIIGKSGQFNLTDVPKDIDASPGRFNTHQVDLNRNFDCNWKPKSMWKSHEVSAGTSPFSEPESQAIRDLVYEDHPSAVVFWHSQSNAVYASACNNGILPQTLSIMNAYASAAKYPAIKSFDSYTVTGDAEGWLASIGIPAITVELETHGGVEWERNLLGINAIISYYSTLK